MAIREKKVMRPRPDMVYSRILGYNIEGTIVDGEPFALTDKPHSEVKSGNLWMFTARAKEICWLSDWSGKKRLKIFPGDILLWKYVNGFEINLITKEQLNAYELF